MLKQFCTTKPQSLLIGCPAKQLNCVVTTKFNGVFDCKIKEKIYMSTPMKSLVGYCSNAGFKEGNVAVFRKFSSGFCVKRAFWDHQLVITRGLSNSSSQKIVEGGGKTLPWLAKSRAKEAKGSENVVAVKASRSSWEVSAEKFLKEDTSTQDTKEMYRSNSRRNSFRDESDIVEEEGVEEIDDPRWHKIKSRYVRIAERKPGSDRPELRKWSKQEDWGRKTWKEATESNLPKLIGEGVYGVGPVLAALLAGRREFYALYVQEGLDLRGNNRKKKDKKGFEKILRIVEKIGVTRKEVSKHDLNMVADNRPHQGLVLDASPLEMVSIKELEPVLVEEQHGPLWVALDEVTDPQNLGAIIRSAYFFGVSGVVLCAKNSAPLSGVVSKASAGSLELMELRSCKNMMQFLTSSAENGWRVLGGSVSSRAVPLKDIVPGAPTILVLGSEGTGLRPLVERSCTQLIKIPGNTPANLVAEADDYAETADTETGVSAQEFSSFMAVESLNVSVAAGVLLHHLIGTHYSTNSDLVESK